MLAQSSNFISLFSQPSESDYSLTERDTSCMPSVQLQKLLIHFQGNFPEDEDSHRLLLYTFSHLAELIVSLISRDFNDVPLIRPYKRKADRTCDI